MTRLFAESFSGPIGIVLAARNDIAGLVLCNTFAVLPRSWVLKALLRPALLRLRAPAALVRYYLVGRDASDSLVARVRATVASVAAAVLAARSRNVLTVNVLAELAKCRAPIVYLRGSEDRLLSEASVDSIVAGAKVPVSVVRIPGPLFLLQVDPDAACRAIYAHN